MSASTTTSDVKSTVKSMKQHIDGGAYALVVSTAAQLSPSALDSASSDAKLKSLAYTFCAFLGLAQFHLQQYDAAERTFKKAATIQEEQFPAYKGLYDVYTQTGASAQLRGVLEKLVATAPPGLKKLGYTVQLTRMQVEQAGTDTTPSLVDLQSTLERVLPQLSVPAESKDPAKDAVEVTRLTLESHTTLVLIAESLGRVAKSTELKVRLDRQLKKYRDEKVASDKLKAQQAASKAGAIAAAVAVVKGGPAPPTQAEEEAEVVRKVTLKLEKDFLEKSDLDAKYAAVLRVPAVSQEGLDPNHRLIHERMLERTILRTEVQGAWTTSAASFADAIQQIESSASRLFDLSASTPSAFACRLLVGVRWTVGGIHGQPASVRAEALKRQQFFEQAAVTLTASSTESGNAWMAWHALAASMVSTEVAPTIPLPPVVNDALANLATKPNVLELADIILKTVTPVMNESSPSVAASSSTPPAAASLTSTSLPAATPLVPSYLSLVAQSFALQRQGESRYRECMAALQHGLSAIKSYKASYPFDARVSRGLNHLELTLGVAYSMRVLDERILDSGVRIFERVLKATRESAQPDAYERESQIRALHGLAQCALLVQQPQGDYAQADAYASELAALTPDDDWVWGTRGFIKFEAAMSLKKSARRGQDGWPALLEEASQALKQARTLQPTAPLHALRLGRVYWEQPAGQVDPLLVRETFEAAESLSTTALASLPAASAAAASLRVVLADALGLQGLWQREVAHDLDAAKKLFGRALKVDASNEVAGEALCDLLLRSSTNDETAPRTSTDARRAAVRTLAHAAVSVNPRCLWGWRRLGRCQLGLRAFAAAIVSFQNALRIDSTSAVACSVWAELAECYNSVGQFVAAFKAMTRCVEIDDAQPASEEASERLQRQIYRFHLAHCQLNLGSMTEAIATLEAVVVATGSAAAANKTEPFVPAIKLLAESLFVLANTHVQSGAYEAASSAIERALSVARRCIDALSVSSMSTDRHSVALWKLVGDCYALYNSLPTDAIPNGDNAATAAEPETSDLTLHESRKLAFLQLSTRAYAKAAHLDPTVSESWYDAAVSQLQSALALHAPAGVPAASVASNSVFDSPPVHPLELVHRSRAIALVQSALRLSPLNTCYWHLLAVADVRPLVRQHAFAQAVSYDPKDAMGWTALGCFYLQQYHVLTHEAAATETPTTDAAASDARQVILGLSRHALELSQTLDPSNPSLWMSQGLFNQGVASLEAYVQSKACFIRSLELHPTQVARFGLAYTAYCTGDIAAADFAIRKFTQQYPRQATAWNLAGLIWEHASVEAEQTTRGGGASFAADALDAFVRAEQLLLLDPQFDPARKVDLLRMVRVNRARVAVTAAAYTEAIALYQALIQEAAAQAQSGAVPPATVLASALTLHVDLAAAYTKAGATAEAINVLDTAVAISAQQVASVPTVDPSDPAAPAHHQQRGELVLARRGLLLQQAQLQAMSQQWDASKQLLQQSVSEHAEHPHPLHYFHCMSALYALALQQRDMPTATYAVNMMSQCIDGLVVGAHSEEVMSSLLRTFHRIQAHLAILVGDAPRAARLYQKLVHLDPTALDAWNEFYQFTMQHRTDSPDTIAAVFSTCTLPGLDFVHVNRLPQRAYARRIELLALAYLQVGRTGYHGGAVVADRSIDAAGDDSDSASLWKDIDAADQDESEYKDDAADEDVRSKDAIAITLASTTSDADVWPRVDNLNSSRLAAHLLHIDPTNTNSWGIQAMSTYSQAVQAAASETNDNATAPLFTKAIKLLQVYTARLTAELTSSHARVAPLMVRSATLDLFNCQVVLVDCYLRRGDLTDAQQLLDSIVEQQQARGADFPIEVCLVWTLFARLALRSGDAATAIKHYRAAIESKPLAVEIWEEMSAVYLQQGAVQAAEACLQAVLSLIKAEAVSAATLSLLHRVYLRLSHHAYTQQQFDRSAEYAQLATRETGAVGASSASAFFLLGVSHLGASHPDQAMRAFQQALNLHLSSADRAASSSIEVAFLSYPLGTLKFHMALLFLRSAAGTSAADAKTASLQEARDFLQQELAAGIANGPIYYQLALTASKLNDTAAALSYIRSALQLRPGVSAYQRLQLEIERADAAKSTDTASGADSAAVPDSWDQ